MTTLIGLAPGARGPAALHLGAMMARSANDDLVVATIVPTPWPPSLYPGEAEYLDFQERAAHEALAQARLHLGTEPGDEFVVHRARSVSSGLLEIAAERKATLVVLGSSSVGVLGQVALGGVAMRILHSSEVQVTLAPRGYTAGGGGARVKRITAAFGRADAHSDLLHTAVATAQRFGGTTLRVACFAVRPMTALAGSIEPEAEDLVVDAWAKGLNQAITGSFSDGGVSTKVDTVVGQGGSWGEAMNNVEWEAGDVLAVGASSSPINRFLLGSHASKIVRSSPVPVVLMPRTLHP